MTSDRLTQETPLSTTDPAPLRRLALRGGLAGAALLAGCGGGGGDNSGGGTGSSTTGGGTTGSGSTGSGSTGGGTTSGGSSGTSTGGEAPSGAFGGGLGRLLIGISSNQFAVVDLPSRTQGKVVKMSPSTDTIAEATSHSSGRFIVTTDAAFEYSVGIRIFDINGDLLRSFDVGLGFGHSVAGARMSPDGQWIAFCTSSSTPTSLTTRGHVWVYSADGTLAFHYILDRDWNIGKSFLFHDWQSDNRLVAVTELDQWIIDPGARSATLLRRLALATVPNNFTLTGGNQALFYDPAGGGVLDDWTGSLDLSTGAVTRLTTGGKAQVYLTQSPDRKWILFFEHVINFDLSWKSYVSVLPFPISPIPTSLDGRDPQLRYASGTRITANAVTAWA